MAIRFHGATQSSYDPANLTVSATYIYYCEVTDDCGVTKTTDSKTIQVVNDPVITVSGGGVFCQNASVVLSSSVSGGTGTMLFQWESSLNNNNWSTVTGATNQNYNPPTSIGRNSLLSCYPR